MIVHVRGPERLVIDWELEARSVYSRLKSATPFGEPQYFHMGEGIDHDEIRPDSP